MEAYLHGKPAFVAKCSRLVKTKAFDNFIIFVVCTRLAKLPFSRVQVRMLWDLCAKRGVLGTCCPQYLSVVGVRPFAVAGGVQHGDACHGLLHDPRLYRQHPLHS